MENKKNKYSGHSYLGNLESGYAWPDDYATPVFSIPAAVLDTIEKKHLAPDEKLTFSTFQGYVNKTKNRVLIIENRKWIETFNFKTIDYNADTKFDLIKKYKDVITGIVLYSTEKSVHYRNLASTVANINGFIPVTKDIKDKLSSLGIDFSKENIIDITGLEYTTPLEIYDYMYDNYWKDCSKRMILSMNPDGNLEHCRDMAAVVKAAVVYCSTLSFEGKLQYEKFLKDMAHSGDSSIVLGWFEGERSGISAASRFGIPTLPADFYISATVFAGMDRKINIPKVPKRPPLENKAYIVVYYSDGDNIQYCQRGMRDLWDSAKDHMGKVALNWTIAPGLADIGPGILNYFYNIATEKECFVTGPSGMGYVLAHSTIFEMESTPFGDYLKDIEYIEPYTEFTETYLQKSGIRVVTVWDGAPYLLRKSYEEKCRSMYGATVLNHFNTYVKGSTVNNRLRFELLIKGYSRDYKETYEAIEKDLAYWNETGPVFLPYQLRVWSKDLVTENIVKLESELRKKFPKKNFEFVRADHYYSYYNEQNNMPFNLAMLSQTQVVSSDDAGMPENVTDGTPVTMWTSSKPGDKFLQYDFGGDYIIQRYVLKNAEMSGMDKSYNSKNWKLETSPDGKTWKTADVYTGNTEAAADIELEHVIARYVKLTITDPGCDGTARIAGLEIYGRKTGETLRAETETTGENVFSGLQL